MYFMRKILKFNGLRTQTTTDPRSTDWPLVQNPLLVLGIVFTWLYFVLVSGPKWMQNRPAFKLKNLLIVYNTFQIVANIAVWIYVSEHYMVK